MDVEVPGTSITHNNDIATICNILSQCCLFECSVQLIKFILELNYLLFQDNICLQVKGTVVGIKLALRYVYIFMADLEDKFSKDYQH